MGITFLTTLTASFAGAAYIKLWKFKFWSKLGLQSYHCDLPFGFANKFIFHYTTPHEEFRKLYNEITSSKVRHGGIYLFTNPVYVPIDPVIIKAILNSSNFQTRQIYHHETKDKYFNAIYYSEAEENGALRAPFQNLPLDKYFNTILTVSQNFVQENNNLDTTSLSKLQEKIIQALFLNQISDKELEKLLYELCEPANYITTKFWLGFVNSSVLKWLFARLSNNRAISRLREELKRSFTSENPIDKESFLGELIGKADPDSLENFTIEVISMIMGMVKSVSSTVTFCLWELARDGAVQAKLAKELESLDKITQENLKDLKFLDAVIKETLRKYPVVAAIKRLNKKKFAVPMSSVCLDENSDVIIPVSGLHYDEKYFDKPEQFNPERFLNGDLVEYTYLPFGFGERACVGQQMALVQIKLILVVLLKNYRLTPTEGGAEVFRKDCFYATPCIKVNLTRV